MMFAQALSLAVWLPLAVAHFTLEWPIKRGFDDDKSSNFPCGGFDSVSSNRTDFPLSGGPIQLDLHHSQTQLAVYMAIGDSPDKNFNIQLRQRFERDGLGNFCLGQVSIPSNLNLSAGTKATIQVVSNGDPSGGLYQCADVTLTDKSLSQSDYNTHCQNATGQVTGFQLGNPNETTSGTPTQSGAGSSPSPSHNAAPMATSISWLLGAAGALAFGVL